MIATRAPSGRWRSLALLVTRRWRLAALAVLAIAAANLFVRLDRDAVETYDEARYGVAAYEMLRAGAWLVPTYGGEIEYWNLKPPLGSWLAIAGYRACGPGRLGLRLPSAIATLACIALVMAWARRRFDRRIALIAGLALATSFPFIDRHSGRTGDLDAPFVLLATAAVLAARSRLAPARRAWLTAALVGLAFLVKGFAVVPIVAVIAAQEALGADRERRVAIGRWLAAAALPLAMAVAWAFARAHAQGSWEYVRRMALEEGLDRVRSGVDGRPWSPWFYVQVLMSRFAPWPAVPLLLPLALLGRRRVGAGGFADRGRFASRECHALWLWALVPFIAYTVARTQCRWYANPILPPLALLAAVTMQALRWRFPRPWAGIAIALVALSGVAIGESKIVREIREDGGANAQDLLTRAARDGVMRGRRVAFAHDPAYIGYAERFILEVEGGADVVEIAASAAPGDAAVIVAETDATPPPGWRELAANGRWRICVAPASP